MISFVLLFLGLLFIFVEFYLPGAIMGIIGTILLFASVILFVQETNSPAAILLFTAGVALSVILLIKYTLRRIPKSRSEYSIYSNKDQEGFRTEGFDPHLIGKTAIVLTDLKPAGYVLVEGRKHPAISRMGYIAKGEQVIVIAGEEENLIVKRVTK